MIAIVVAMVTKPSHQHGYMVKSINDFSLIGFQYKTIKTSDYPGCVSGCLKDSNCKSLNYLMTDGLCDLNTMTKESAPTENYKQRNNNIYFTNILATKGK